MEYYLLIVNGRILDGTGSSWFRADVGIADGKIMDIGDLKSADAKLIIDAEGLFVCPGFMDMHSHSDFTLLVNPRAESKVRQGVTTEVIGNCGSSAAPVRGEAARARLLSMTRKYGVEFSWSTFSEYLEALEDGGVAVNVAALVGHGMVRRCVLGLESRLPTRDELDEMKELVSEAMEAGAFGMSSGLVYPPGRYASKEELIELCRVVARYGGIYASHIRGERETIVEATAEAIEIGERAGVPVQISHHPAKIGGWGKSKDTLRLIEEARLCGVDVNCDLHPYVAGSTGLSALLPAWVQEGGARKIIERLSVSDLRERIIMDMIEEPTPGPGPCGLVKRGMWDKIMLCDCNRNRDLIGKNFEEIAKIRGEDPFEAYLDLVVEEEASGKVVGFYYNEEDIRRVLLHPTSMIGSDGYAFAPYGVLGVGKNHPRSYGAFPMVFRKYVRGVSRKELMYDEGARILSVEEAVRKMTSLPAQKLGLWDRGIIRPGFWADIVIFDLERISDKATYLEPYQYPEGIEYVIVNGEIVIERNRHVGRLPGRVLRHGVG